MKLDKQDIAKVKKRLEKEKRNLLKRIEELKAQDPFSDPERLVDNAASDSDAKEESGHDRYVAMIDELTIRLNNIEDAFTSIKSGTYGQCQKCKKSIDTSRLLALLTAKFCMKCRE